MARNIKKAGGSAGKMQEPVLEPGSYSARLVGITFLGVQKQRPFQGKVKDPIDEVRLTYELSDEFMHDEDGNELEDKPRWVTEQIPFYSLSAERAKSSQRYKVLDPKDESDGDFKKLLGNACSVVTVNNEKDGKTYTNIGGVTAPPKIKGYVQPDLVNDPQYFDPHDEDACSVESFRALPEFIQKMILKADDFKQSVLCGLLEEEGVDTGADESSDEADDNVPDSAPDNGAY